MVEEDILQPRCQLQMKMSQVQQSVLQNHLDQVKHFCFHIFIVRKSKIILIVNYN